MLLSENRSSYGKVVWSSSDIRSEPKFKLFLRRHGGSRETHERLKFLVGVMIAKACQIFWVRKKQQQKKSVRKREEKARVLHVFFEALWRITNEGLTNVLGPKSSVSRDSLEDLARKC